MCDETQLHHDWQDIVFGFSHQYTSYNNLAVELIIFLALILYPVPPC